jgi:hypothetical protein
MRGANARHTGNVDPNYVVSVALPPTPDVPQYYALHPNFPNPFNPETQIAFDLPRAGEVSLKIYNPLGQLIGVLFQKNLSAGRHFVRWDATDGSGANVSSGIYFIQMRAGEFNRLRKMTLLR